MNNLNSNSATHKVKTTAKSFFRDLAVASLMLGLLMAFNKLIKFTTLFIQEFSKLFSDLNVEMEVIERGSKFLSTNNINKNVVEHSHDLNIDAEYLSSQISNSQMLIFVVFFLFIVAFILLYLAIDYLMEYINKFKPWSIILLLVTFVSTVFYIELTDLKETGNGICFMFTTLISIITGIILVGYTMIFPNYVKSEQ
jgi:F0F1-type ATP synthase assembly protein I